ncbi:phosphotransferase family protein [Flexivirga meconopsidis]|uniref:phosphotransferase family protein n=1 Tax=Flexivirga meconopsidis TaxID=2977121 RepID=UPI00223F82EA
MRHGYTNSTERVGDLVLKRYAGPDAEHRAVAERRALIALGGRYPVPEVVATESHSLVTQWVSGDHGQDLIDAGEAVTVLAACGAVLRVLHGLDRNLLSKRATGGVISHGDFGPNNVLLDAGRRVCAVLDWEFSGIGAPITDVAWCEWIVRMHHPDAVGALPAFFDAYGERPSWRQRQAEMLRRCSWLEDFTRRWDPEGAGVPLWQDRAAVTRRWRE